MFGSSLPSALGWLVTTKVYSGTGADIVMESIALTDRNSKWLNSAVASAFAENARKMLANG
jgi:hypothetical protein